MTESEFINYAKEFAKDKDFKIPHDNFLKEWYEDLDFLKDLWLSWSFKKQHDFLEEKVKEAVERYNKILKEKIK